MRFLLIDKVLELNYNDSITGIKAWSLDNIVFMDHFPGYPVVPGVLLTESMAQLLGILIEHSYYQSYGSEFKVFPILSIIQKVKLREFVEPGDQCIVKGKLTSLDAYRGNGKVWTEVDGRNVVEGILSFSIGTEQTTPYTSDMKKRNEFLDYILKNTKFN